MGWNRGAAVSMVVAVAVPVLTGTFATAAGGDRDLTFGDRGSIAIDSTRPTIDVANAAVADYFGPVTVAGAVGDRMAVGRYRAEGVPDDFGRDGLVTADFGAPAVAHGIAVSHGVTAVGQAGGDLAVAAFDHTGHADLSFGRSGKLVVPLGGLSMAEAVTPGGLVVGWVVRNGHRDIVLAQLGGPGGLDNSFNGSGTKVVDLAPGADDAAFAVADFSGYGVYVAGQLGGAAVVARFIGGSLDLNFGIAGTVVLDVTTAPDVARAITVDYETGQLVVAGQAGTRAFVARVTAEGVLVPTFGGGVVQVDLGGTGDVATSVAARSGGAVIVSGTRTSPSGTDAGARRLTSAGVVDPTFGDAGLATADFGTASDRANALAVQTDGRFVLVGSNASDIVLAGFTPGGGVDASFGTGGKVVTDGGARAWELGMVVRPYPDGRVLALGSVGGEMVLARVLADGGADRSFGGTGVVADEFGGGDPLDAAIQPDGRILVLVGTTDIGGHSLGRLVRYLPDGRRDPSFGPNGDGTAIRGPGYRSSLLLLPDGSILLAGKSWTGLNAVARVLSSGVLDPTFGDDGFAAVGELGPGGALDVQSDGKIILAVKDRAAYATVHVVRLTASGARDRSFGSYTLTDVGGPPIVKVLPDDRVYVVGAVPVETTAYGAPLKTDAMTIARLGRDGDPDVTFGANGRVRLDVGRNEYVSDAAIDGPSLALVGQFSDGSGSSKRAVVRVTSTGGLDSRYGSGGVATFSDLAGLEGVIRDGEGRLVLIGTVRGTTDNDISVSRLQPGPATDPSPGTTSTSVAPTTAPAPGATSVTTTVAPTPAASRRSGYWMVSRAGGTYAFGDAGYFGNAASTTTVDIEPTPSGEGYWMVDASGAVQAFGDARHRGGVNGRGLATGEEVTSLSVTPTGAGYWLFTTNGRAVPFGDAVFRGDMGGVRLNGPVLDSVATPTGRGYYMVASDGGIFAFGDAGFRGSMGGKRLNAPVQSLVPDHDGVGYWLVASDGGVFAFDAQFRGSMGATRLNRPTTGMVRFGNGYLMVGEDGGIFNFSDKQFFGSLGANPPPSPIVAVAALDR